MSEKTTLYVIFRSAGLDHRGSWDAGDIEQKVMTNEEILSEVEKRCEGVEFVGMTDPVSIQSARWRRKRVKSTFCPTVLYQRLKKWVEDGGGF